MLPKFIIVFIVVAIVVGFLVMVFLICRKTHKAE